nr:DMT family transporter [uncultured Limnohabitans sp.]
MRWTHARAVWTMVGVTALWSIAGIVTRQLESAQSFEVTFWRSLFTVVSLLVILPLYQGREFFSRLFYAPRVLWLSGVCWAVMFTAFMVALTLAPVAEVLITMAVGPLLSALVARVFFGQRIAAHTWWSIALAGVGMAWMFALPSTAATASAASWGTWVALLVPTAAAVNWSVVQHAQTRGESVDMVPAVLVGAVLSALCTLPLAWPLQASAPDVAWLALLGLVQLAVPCVLVVVCARVLPAPEISLLALLEVLFGIALAWLGANEVPSTQVLSGGTLVLLALLFNAWWAQRLTTGDRNT